MARWKPGLFWGIALLLGWGSTTPVQAAKQVTVRFGVLQQTVAVRDLSQFAHKGDIPPSLKLFAPLLTQDVQQTLDTRLELDPAVVDTLVDDLLESPAGERMLKALEVILPGSTRDKVRYALIRAVREHGGLSLLTFLRSYPAVTLTVDAKSAIALASKINLPYWQSQALGSILQRELTVKHPEPIQSELDPTQYGHQWVRRQTLVFNDYRRHRSIPVDLYWSRYSHGPLVVLSHGFGADRRFLSYLAYHLASHGITVAALEHPASNVAWLTDITSNASYRGQLGDILPASEFIERPKDITFLLNELEQLSRYSYIMRRKLNVQEAVVIGHSLGGYTALSLAGARLNLKHLRQFCDRAGSVALSAADWLQCTAAEIPNGAELDLKDHRIRGVIALNPVIGQLFDPGSLSRITVPTLMVAGTDDSITPAVSQQLLPFATLKTRKYLVTAIGATHLSVGDPSNLNYALTRSLFMRERSENETEALRTLLRGLSLAFVEQFGNQATLYQSFLSPSYVQSLSTPELQLRLTAELPPNLFTWLEMAALPLEKLVSDTLETQQLKRRQQDADYLGLGRLLYRVPLLMFIVPGALPLLRREWLRLTRQKRDRTWYDPLHLNLWWK